MRDTVCVYAVKSGIFDCTESHVFPEPERPLIMRIRERGLLSAVALLFDTSMIAFMG